MTTEFNYKKIPLHTFPSFIAPTTETKETTLTTSTTLTTRDKRVTFRLSQEWYDKLKELGEPKNFSTIVKEALGLWQIEMKK
jgi:hypothetical protein